MTQAALKVRSRIVSAATFGLVSLSFKLATDIPALNGLTGLGAWLAWGLSFGLSLWLANAATEWFWNSAADLRLFRKWVLGPVWLEGCWFMQVIDEVNGKEEVVQASLTEFRYGGPEMQLYAQFDSTDVGTSSGAEKRTSPILMAVDKEGHYVHSFERKDTLSATPQATGVAVGVFSSDRGGTPDRYIGNFTYLFSAAVTKNETGYKIADKRRDEWIAKYGINWRQKVLHDPQELANLCVVYDPVRLNPPGTSVASAASAP